MKLVMRATVQRTGKREAPEAKKVKISLGELKNLSGYSLEGLVYLDKKQADQVCQALKGKLEGPDYVFPDPAHEGWEITCDKTHIQINSRSHEVYNFSEFDWKVEPVAQGETKKVASK